MERRSFVRSSLAAALFAPGALSLPDLAHATPRRRSAADPVRLSNNENPLGMPEAARTAITDAIVKLGNRYPNLGGEVVTRLSQKLGVARENVVLGNGSSEILQMVVQAMSVGGQNVRVVIPDPTYESVERYSIAMGAQVVKVPLRADHTHDLDRMRAAAKSGTGPVLVFICNPNNPTGTLTPVEPVAVWIREAPANTWFLIDEAYFEFVSDPGYRTFVPEATSRPNVVVSRTFSKIYGLAGVRLGYGVADRETIQKVDAFASGTNINQFALVAGLACMADDGTFMRRSLTVNNDGRKFVYQTLDQVGLEYLPSHANFVMHRIHGDLSAYITRMREAGVLVGRRFPPMLSYNRVSIGLPEELQVWAEALRKLKADGAL
jgi:histidinol-phosphate aminotransferase